MKPSKAELDEFVRGYITCALWSSTEDDASGNMGSPLDENYSADDVLKATRKEMIGECRDFLTANYADCVAHGEAIANRREWSGMEQCGHDFWLTRNGHGAGFWDRGTGDIGERLSKAARVYGGVDLYVYRGKVRA